MSLEEASLHPSAQALTQAIGAKPQLELDVLELSPQPGDVFLLCSDGLYQELSSESVGQALSLTTPQAAVKQLFDCALRGPAHDNLTAVVVRL